MSKHNEIVKKFLDSFSEQEKNDIFDTEDELLAISEFMKEKMKASKKNLTGTNEIGNDDVPRK